MSTDFEMEQKRGGHRAHGGHDPYEMHDSYQSSPAAYQQPAPRAFNVIVHNNGDGDEPGKPFLVKSNALKTFDIFLDELSLKMKPRFLCGRRLYTARGRHKIQAIKDLTPGATYVLTGTEQYKDCRYGEIHGKKPPFYRQKDFNKPYYAKPKYDVKGVNDQHPIEGAFQESGNWTQSAKIRPVLHARDEHLRKKSGRARYLNEHCHGLRLRVHSQKRSNPCQPVAVPHFQTKNFDKIREIISEAVGINEKSLLIYKFSYGGEGCQLVNRAEELQTDDAILAVYKHNYRGKPYTPKDLEIDKYQPGGYANFTTQISGSPRKDDQISPRPYRHKKSLNKWKDPLPSIGSSSKQSGPISPYSNPPSQGGRTQHSNRSRPSRQVDYDADQSGIYRAKGQDNSRGAKQVNETHDTRTERPIDQMEAEEVAEEEFLSKEKTTPIPSGTELNKKPSAEQKKDQDVETKKKSEVKKNNKTNGKDRLYVSEIPPVVDEEKGIKVNKDDKIKTEKTEDKESQVEEDTFENYKEKNTPKELQTNTVSPNKPPLSTSPPDSSKAVDAKEKINEDMREGQQHDPWDDPYEQTERSNNPRNSTPASTREARLRDEQRQTQAATKLQAGARGWKARRDFKAKKQQQEDNRRQEEEMRRHEDDMRKRDEDSKRQDLAATKIQAGFKGYKVRKARRDKLQVSENRRKREKERNEAAVKIQSGFRGYMTRKYTHKKLEKQNIDMNANDSRKDEEKVRKQHEAAVKIQSSFRGYQVRKNAARSQEQSYDKQKEEAAKKIQASFKGYHVRKDIAKQMEEKREQEESKRAIQEERQNAAATKIQAGFRGYRVRKQPQMNRSAQNKQRDDEAATKIQAAARGYQTRKSYKQNHEPQLPDSTPKRNNRDENDLNMAATKIQSAFKGYQTRKAIKSQVTSNVFDISDLKAIDIDQLPESTVSRLTHRKGHSVVQKRLYLVTYIQTAFRAYHSRKLCNNVSKDPHFNRSLIILKAAWEGYAIRKRYREKVVKKQALLESHGFTQHTNNLKPKAKEIYSKSNDKLQAAIRGYLTRKHAVTIMRTRSKMMSVDNADHFATFIQALCKGYLVRHDLTTPKPMSAGSLQGPTSPKTPKKVSPQTSYWEDSNVKMHSDKTLRLAATKIQAVYYMHRTRARICAWKLEQSVYAEQTPYKSDELEKATSIIKGHFLQYVERKSQNSGKASQREKANERSLSSENVCSVRNRKRDSSGKFKRERGEDKERLKSILWSSRLGENEIGLRADTNITLIESQSLSKVVSPRSSLPSSRDRYSCQEVEKEGESLKEVEDDEGEMSSMEKNVNAVSQLQAAFWAYKLRREISELISGGGELIDIKKIDREVSALRRDFSLRSAKIRRLGFDKSRSGKKILLDEDQGKFKKEKGVPIIKRAFKDFQLHRGAKKALDFNHNVSNSDYMKGSIEVTESNYEGHEDSSNAIYKKKHIDANYKRFLERLKARDETIKMKNVAKIAAAMSRYANQKKENEIVLKKKHSVYQITAAIKDFQARKSSFPNRKTTEKEDNLSKIHTAFAVYKSWRDGVQKRNKEQNLQKIKNAFVSYKHNKSKSENEEREKNEKGGILRQSENTEPVYKENQSLKFGSEGPVHVKEVKATEEFSHSQLNERKKAGATLIKVAFERFASRKNAIPYKHESSQRQRMQKRNKEQNLQKIKNAFVSYKHNKSKFKSEKEEREKNEKESILRQSENTDPVYKENQSFKFGSEGPVHVKEVKATEEFSHSQLNERKKAGATLIKVAFERFASRKNVIPNKHKSSQRQKSARSCRSNKSLHVEMHSSILTERATELQAAFAGYQVRRVFLSLSKMVESDTNTFDRKGPQLERMGSLSETDDFKLRHKSIVKLRAFNKQHELETLGEKQLKEEADTNSAKPTNLPLIPYIGKSPIHLTRAKTGITVVTARNDQFISKSYTQPDFYASEQSNQKGSRIEAYIKQKAAATCIQAALRGYLVRKKFKKQNSAKKQQRPKSSDRISKSAKSNKVSFTLTQVEENNIRKQEQFDMVRVRTSSVKLEAERRKVVASALKLKKQANEAKQATSFVKIQAQKKKEVIISYQKNAEQENKSALCIQKNYRGYKVRKELKDRRLLMYEAEYEQWKFKRINAAIAIQSGWRGYIVRKDLKDKEDELMKELHPQSVRSETSESVSPAELPQLIVINIGRTKSEIERAEKRYENSSMLQMVVRASKMRRKMQVRLTRRRLTNKVAASKIQALYLGFVTKRMVKVNGCSTRLQSMVKAHWTREKKYEAIMEKKRQKQKAASLLQAVYYGQMKKANILIAKEKRLQNKAATDIKVGFKGYAVREELCERKKAIDSVTVSEIHACVRGWKERMKTTEKKRASTLITSVIKSYMKRHLMKQIKEKLEREKKQASRIQAGYKAIICRKSFKVYLDKRVREFKLLSQLQAAYRGCSHRTAFRKHFQKVKRNREQSAIKIQAMYRGYIGRKIALDRQNAKQIHNHAKFIIDLLLNSAFEYIGKRADSAERIQATAKGHQIRNKVTSKLRLIADKRYKEKHTTASTIQTMFCVRQTRNRIHKRKVLAVQTKALIKVQAAIRGRQSRAHFRKKRQLAVLNMAASLVQTVVRVQQQRTKMKDVKELQIQHEAATKIQAFYRGYSVRLDVERERKFVANLIAPVLSPRTRSGRQLSLEVDEVLMRNAGAMILFHRKASELQAAFKAYLVRKELTRRLAIKTHVDKKTPRKVVSSRSPSVEDKAAMVVQKTFRGYSDRKAFKRLIVEKRKVWYSASSRIQASLHGYRVRMEEKIRKKRLEREGVHEMLKRKRKVANMIVYAYRGLKYKQFKIAKRYEM